MRYLLSFICAMAMALGLTAQSVLAQPAGAIGDDFIYIVESGDTLSDLAELYTTSSDQWRKLKDLNQVEDELRLPIGKQIAIPFTMIPVMSVQAVLTHFRGEVWVNGTTATKDHTLQDGDVIRTGANGFATLQLEDQSTLSLPSNSQLHIKQLNAFKRTRINDAILELQQGSIESRVAPENTGVGRFEIHTPLSITGVRGTNLRVHTQNQQSRTELLSGAAHLNSENDQYQNLKKGYGASISADGSHFISPLLPAPVLGDPVRSKGGFSSTLQPINQAEYYLVQITLDSYGAEIVKSFTLDKETQHIPLAASTPEIHYAFVRAIDSNGLMGMDASVSFPGRNALISSDGAAVLSIDGQAILLTEF